MREYRVSMREVFTGGGREPMAGEARGLAKRALAGLTKPLRHSV